MKEKDLILFPSKFREEDVKNISSQKKKNNKKPFNESNSKTGIDLGMINSPSGERIEAENVPLLQLIYNTQYTIHNNLISIHSKSISIPPPPTMNM